MYLRFLKQTLAEAEVKRLTKEIRELKMAIDDITCRNQGTVYDPKKNKKEFSASSHSTFL